MKWKIFLGKLLFKGVYELRQYIFDFLVTTPPCQKVQTNERYPQRNYFSIRLNSPPQKRRNSEEMRIHQYSLTRWF